MDEYVVPWDLLPYEVTQITKTEVGWEMYGELGDSEELHCFGKVWDAICLPEHKLGKTYFRRGFKRLDSATRLKIYGEDLGVNYSGYPVEAISIDEIGEAIDQLSCKKFYKNLRYRVELHVFAVEENYRE